MLLKRYPFRRGEEMKEIHSIHRTYKQGDELPYRLDAIHVNEKGKTECVYQVTEISLGAAINSMILGTSLGLKEALELIGPLTFSKLTDHAKSTAEVCAPPYDDWILLMRR
jgi:hypothetical protein